MIVAENIHKTLNGQEVLRGASLRIEDGEMVALIGSSGEGKTVLLKHLAGFFQPDEGRVLVDGTDMCCLRGRELEELRSHLGFLFQGGALFLSMTVYENIAFPLQEKTELSEEEIHDRVMEELRHVGMEGTEAKYPAELSGGMAKRVALARSLIQSPRIMLFDEPTTGLDPIIVHRIHNLINSMRDRLNLTSVIVTHEIPSIFSIVDKVAMLHEGVIRFMGTPEEVLECDDDIVRDFIEGSMPPPEYWIGHRSQPDTSDQKKEPA